MLGMRRKMRQPGSSLWNTKADSPRRGSSDVRAIRMKCEATAAPEMNHFRPEMMYRSFLRSALVSIMPPGSEPEPGCGSVITKEERTSPSMIGCSHLSFISSVGSVLLRIDMLPSSGAWQLTMTGPKIERAASS